jgi:aspartate oxidase
VLVLSILMYCQQGTSESVEDRRANNRFGHDTVINGRYLCDKHLRITFVRDANRTHISLQRPTLECIQSNSGCLYYETHKYVFV